MLLIEALKSDTPPITSSASGATSNVGTSTQSQSTPPSSTALPGSNEESSSSSGGLSAGGIAGITIGVLVIVVAILLFIFWRMLRARRRKTTKPAPLDESVGPFHDKQDPSSFPSGHIHARSLSDSAPIVASYMHVSQKIIVVASK